MIFLALTQKQTEQKNLTLEQITNIAKTGM